MGNVTCRTEIHNKHLGNLVSNYLGAAGQGWFSQVEPLYCNPMSSLRIAENQRNGHITKQKPTRECGEGASPVIPKMARLFRHVFRGTMMRNPWDSLTQPGGENGIQDEQFFVGPQLEAPILWQKKKKKSRCLYSESSSSVWIKRP